MSEMFAGVSASNSDISKWDVFKRGRHVLDVLVVLHGKVDFARGYTNTRNAYVFVNLH